jgi:hypothetical protein
MAEAVRDGQMQIPISQKLPLKEARQGHIALEKGAWPVKYFSKREHEFGRCALAATQ